MEKRVIPVVRQREIKRNIIQRVQPPIPKINALNQSQEIIAKNLALQKANLVRPQIRFVQKVVQNNARLIKTGRTNVQNVSPAIKDSNYNKLMSIKNSGSGQILVMIACGPSANEVDFLPLKGKNNIKIMVINKPISYIWPVDYWAFCDHSQYVRNKADFDSYNGLLINSIGVKAPKPNQVLVKAMHGKGFSRDITNGYYIGRSSVYANMQTALFMNFAKIFIFGIDMCAVDGKTHHYGNGFNPDVAPDLRIQRFAYEAEHYSGAGEILSEDIRKKFYFCSSYNPWPFTEKFNKWDHKDAVAKILDLAK